MRLLADANIFMAVILNEPEKIKIVEKTQKAEIISPIVLPYEIGNALSAINKQKKLSKDEIHKCYQNFKLILVRLQHFTNALISTTSKPTRTIFSSNKF